MTRRTVPTQRLARWSLLLAAVLQLGGAAVGPYLHFSGLALVAVPNAAPQGGEEERSAPLPRHDEQACIVCQTVAATALVPAEAPLLAASLVPDPRLPEPTAPTSRTPRSGSRARAPPTA